MSQNDIIIRTHYKSPHRLHIDSDIPTPSSEPINQFARQLITLLDTSDLSSMLSYCVTQEFTANCRKISQNCYSTALFTINFATSPIHTENILITLHYKKEIISLLLETTPIKAKEGANKRGNSSRLTQSFHFFMFESIFSPVNALNQPI